MAEIPSPPEHLGEAGRALWGELHGQYELTETHHLRLLARACEQEDRISGYRTVLAREGVVVVDPKGRTRPHPCLAEERAAGNLQRLLLRELGLDHAGSPTEAARLPRGGRYNGGK